ADAEDLGVAREQLARFADVVRAIGERPRYVHAAASAAVDAFGAIPGCNAIRPGLGIYGLHLAPHLVSSTNLRPALEWRSRVRRVVDAKRDTGVAYGHEYHLARDGRVATVPVGYGDGLARSAGKRGRVLVAGRRVPFAGRISMDLMNLDVSDLPTVGEGDEVVRSEERRVGKECRCRWATYH